MIPVLTAAQAAAWDERARREAGIPGRVLMESAGRGTVGVLSGAYPGALEGGVGVAVGPGNNGGDGWVIARALHAARVRVWVTESAGEAGGARGSADCEANRALAVADGVEIVAGDGAWPHAAVMVDAILGTGASGAPRGAIRELALRVAAQAVPVVAVDGPTGLDLTTGECHGPIRAELTVTFGGFRRGHLLAREWCGRIVVIDIGFPAPDRDWPAFVDDRWAGSELPPLSVGMHKGDRGRVLVVGGDEGMAGAAILLYEARRQRGPRP